MKDLVSIIDVKDHVGEEIKIGAWVADKSGKENCNFSNSGMVQLISKLSFSNQTCLKNLVKKQD